ncbi:MAG: alpha-1 4-glucan-protein synthase [Halobacteriaceae archaeon]
MEVCVTVPTVRNPECVEAYVHNAREHGVDTDRLFFLLVTEDFCDKAGMAAMLDDLGVAGEVVGESEREAWYDEHGIAEYGYLVPANSHAETSFGLLWMLAEDCEYGVFIDDDTAPIEGVDFFGSHLDRLGSRPEVEHVRSDEQWVNVLYQNHDRHGLYPRGYPYGAMGETIETETRVADPVVACQGLWTNIPDLDAVRILMDGDLRGQAQTLTRPEDFPGDFVADRGQFLTVCSMNLSFEAEVIPAFYQFPMDDNRWDIGRFDDIWSGLTLKRAADMLGRSVLSGAPLCEHNKAERSTFADLNNEVPALELNEHLWEALAETPDDADDYYEAYEAMIAAVEAHDFSAYANSEFVDYCVEHMRDWLDVCRLLD